MAESTYFLNGMPLPLAEPATAAFWEGCAARELRIQKCASCGLHRHPPGPICSRCRSFECAWDVSQGTGHVFSFIVVHHSVFPATNDVVPYNVSVIELDDCGRVLITSNVIDCPHDDLHVGMAVHLVWEQVDESLWLYRFARK